MKNKYRFLSILLTVALLVSVFSYNVFAVDADPETTEVIVGDVNGDTIVDTNDLIQLRKYFANYNYDAGEASDEVGAGADCNEDGRLTALDISCLRKYLTNKDFSEDTDIEPEETKPEVTEPEVTEPEEEIKFIKAIDHIYIGDFDVANPNGGWGGELFTYDASSIAATGFTVKWTGWAGVNDGFKNWVYSTDGGNTWQAVGGRVWNTTDAGRLNALNSAGFTNATANGSLDITADLSAITSTTAEVIFAAVPNSNPEKIIPMVKIINIKLPNDCTHPSVGSWTPVAGETKETGTCTRCGETIERDTTFVICLDNVAYSGGNRGWAATVAQSTPYVVNNVASMPIDSTTGLGVLGWVAMNGDVSKYMWSVDGVTWHDAGTGYFDNDGIIGAVNGYNTGIANYTAQCQFDLKLTGLCSLAAGTYTVYLGAVPANNTEVVVPVAQIDNVVVQ